MPQPPPDDLSFGRVVIKPARRQVLIDGKAAALGARALDVLLVLIAKREQVVTKDELLDQAWPGLVVEENNLQVQISALRKVLGAGAIATIPGRGYQFTPCVDAGRYAPSAVQDLPPQLTAFVGREDDLADLALLLAHERMLTLTGIGGCGKTRLALKLAELLRASFADGICYVDLAPLQDADRLDSRIAAAFGIREDGSAPVVDLLCRHLGGRHLLMVLDNCEHLGTSPRAVVQVLLSMAPRLTVLATSREGLAVPGERIVAVRSLKFPAAGTTPTAAELVAFEAAALFIDRARSINRRFGVDDDSAPVLAEICRRLDGIPLAIELAAARTKVLGLEEIRARLVDRFRLLTGGSRIAVGRQQTLLATVQWSHDQLTEEERQVLGRLSVFAGGWTLDAALAVAGEPSDEYAMLDVLGRLVDHSLITVHTTAAGGTRYGMLETVRAYGQGQLGEAKDVVATRDRHVRHFLKLAETAKSGLYGHDQLSWQTRLSDDLENLLVAHAWSEQMADGGQIGLQLVTALRPFLSEAGLYLLGEKLASQALDRAGAEAPDLERCRGLAARAFLVFFVGRYEQSMADAQASLVLARKLENESEVANALWIVGFDHLALGEPQRARAVFEELLTLARATGDSRQTIRALTGLAEVARSEGLFAEAMQLNEDVLVRHRDQNDTSGMVIVLGNLTMTALALGQTERAAAHLRAGVALADTLRRDRPRIAQLFCAAGLAVSRREWERAARFLGAMHAIAEPMNYHLEPADVPFVDSVVASTTAAMGVDAFSKARARGRSLSVNEAITELRHWLNSP